MYTFPVEQSIIGTTVVDQVASPAACPYIFSMERRSGPADLHGLFTDIIEGRTVKRARHELVWEKRVVTLEFVEALRAHGYLSTTVASVEVNPGERVPAFFIQDRTAWFGWVFWEKFSQLKLRKLFGSVVRNEKGDWAIQVPSQRGSVIYANPALRTEMDIDNPSGF
jgi:hypothetical protein